MKIRLYELKDYNDRSETTKIFRLKRRSKVFKTSDNILEFFDDHFPILANVKNSEDFNKYKLVGVFSSYNDLKIYCEENYPELYI